MKNADSWRLFAIEPSGGGGMSEGDDEVRQRVVVSVTWPALIAIITAALLIVPGAFALGNFSRKTAELESRQMAHIGSSGHAGMQIRMTIAEAKLERLDRMERTLAKIAAKMGVEVE